MPFSAPLPTIFGFQGFCVFQNVSFLLASIRLVVCVAMPINRQTEPENCQPNEAQKNNWKWIFNIWRICNLHSFRSSCCFRFVFYRNFRITQTIRQCLNKRCRFICFTLSRSSCVSFCFPWTLEHATKQMIESTQRRRRRREREENEKTRSSDLIKSSVHLCVVCNWNERKNEFIVFLFSSSCNERISYSLYARPKWITDIIT